MNTVSRVWQTNRCWEKTLKEKEPETKNIKLGCCDVLKKLAEVCHFQNSPDSVCVFSSSRHETWIPYFLRLKLASIPTTTNIEASCHSSCLSLKTHATRLMGETGMPERLRCWPRLPRGARAWEVKPPKSLFDDQSLRIWLRKISWNAFHQKIYHALNN